MAKKRFYAVKNGRQKGVYLSWNDCKEQIDGVSNAVYKGFATRKEAEEYLCEDKPIKTHMGIPERSKADLTVYVDGSFDATTGVYGYGFVAISKEGIEEFSGACNNCEAAKFRNIAGELMGVVRAIEFSVENNYKSIEICYDYMGIEQWATGGWRAKNELTSQYAEYIKEQSQNIDITFKKIAAHTGDKYNEIADQLAKSAIKLLNKN